MKVPSTTQLCTWFALLLAASFRGAAAKSVLAGTHSSTANETDDAGSCMARVLRLLPSTALRLSIQDTETLLISLRQLHSGNLHTDSLSALLGGRQNSNFLQQCLRGQLEQCRKSHPYSDAGKCAFTHFPQGSGAYICHCDDGHTGTFCQIVLPSCSGNPCQNGATCQQGGSSFHCHCPPLYTGKREEKWLDVAKFKQQSNTLHEVSEDVQQLRHELQTGRQDDTNRMYTFLQHLEKRVLKNVNSTMAHLSSEVASLSERLDQLQENQEVSFPCRRTSQGRSGLFNSGTPTAIFTAYCDRETDGGGWTVCQKTRWLSGLLP
ncbi:laminin subunit alpha-3-like [Sycon ciliatum]|uniref:laminin subunit alpha-3-like n=1 Tax=Sycon ciliatum TaxID=27933 RepID=UPI0031F6C2DD